MTTDLLVEPHPLDCDWRFTPDTAHLLASAAAPLGSCLAIGTPSVAAALEARNSPYLLIDRQPIQAVANCQSLDVSFYDKALPKIHETAVLDPPWYPEIFRRWIGWASSQLPVHATIYCSLWPETTRPLALQERAQLFEWLNGWSSFQVIPGYLTYQTPIFEARTHRAHSANTPRLGDLLILEKHLHIEVPAILTARETWHRFVFGSHQIAVRKRLGTPEAVIRQHPAALGWLWPHVSRRAPQRDLVDVWSSRNEVAVVKGGTASIMSAFRQLQGTKGLPPSEVFLNSPLTALRDWDVAKLKFSRSLEWTHQE